MTVRTLEFADWTVDYRSYRDSCGMQGYHMLEGRVAGYELEVYERPHDHTYQATDFEDLKSVQREYVACLGFTSGCAEEWGEPRQTLAEAKRDAIKLALTYCRRGVALLDPLVTMPVRDSGERYRHDDNRYYWKGLPQEIRARVCWRTRDGSHEGQGKYQLIADARAEIAAEEDDGSPYVYWLEDEIGLPTT